MAARSGEAVAAEHEARQLLGADPYDEVAVRALLAALAASGRSASALATYARFRALLAEDLGASPETETEELHARILRGEPSGPAGTPPGTAGTPAPGARADLPGREAALRRLDELLEDAAAGRCILCLVEGEAGMGKTRLLRTWAEGLATLPVCVASVACDELGQVLPLQPLLDLVAALAQEPRSGGVDAVLGPDAPVLAPLLGTLTAATEPTPLAALTDPTQGQGILGGAMTGAVRRLARRGPVVLIVDDVHLADAATTRWLSHAPVHLAGERVLVVASARAEEGMALPGTSVTLALDPLDLPAARAIVGEARAAELLTRSGGNALFLVELAAARDPTDPGAADHLPDSIRRTVEERCTRAGESAAATLRAAAVIGPDVDLDVLAGVTGAAPGQLLDELEEGVRRRLLVEDGPRFAFAHALVREALAASVGAARTAYIHREAARAFAGHTSADPLAAARHARLGGDATGAASLLVDAARIAVARFDADDALRLLHEAIALDDSAAVRVERARVLTMLGRHDDVAVDLEAARALGAGPETLEVAAWSAHLQRRFGEALLLADQGAHDADSDELRASCLSLGGWVALASGDLGGAEARLEGALALAPVGSAVLAESWLAWLRASQGRPAETVGLVHASDGTGLALYRYPNVYALMAATMAHAMLGRPDRALTSLGLLESAIERMDAARSGPAPAQPPGLDRTQPRGPGASGRPQPGGRRAVARRGHGRAVGAWPLGPGRRTAAGRRCRCGGPAARRGAPVGRPRARLPLAAPVAATAPPGAPRAPLGGLRGGR